MRAVVVAYLAFMAAGALFMLGVKSGHELGILLAGCIVLVLGVSLITDQGRLGHRVGVLFASVPRLEHLWRPREPPSPGEVKFWRYAAGVFLVVWGVLAITAALWN